MKLIKMKLYLNTILWISIVLLSCTATNSQTQSGSPTIVDAATFAELLKTKKDAQIMDVRTPGEFSRGYIAGALNLDYNGPDYARQVASLDKNKTVLIYCLSGGRSGAAAKEMRNNGFTEVIELKGGTLAWSKAGLPLEGASTKQPGIDLNTFQQSVQTPEIHLVDFYAPWCAPCKKMKPILEEIEKEYSGKVIVHRINVDENQLLTKEMQVEILPTLKVFKGGKESWSHTGIIEKAEIEKVLK